MISKVEQLLASFNSKNIAEAIDFEKFSGYAIVHHSSGIEGSTLTEIETQVLLDEGITAKGKPLEHHLMVKDHYAALQYVVNEYPQSLTKEYLQHLNAKVMASTGSTYFPNYDKVEGLVDRFIQWINAEEPKIKTLKEQLELSFDAHFDLVSIHPFYDGNGRTSRLLMNGIQHKKGLPMAVVYQEDKQDYYNALTSARSQKSKEPFREFMFSQYAKQLEQTIDAYEKGINQSIDFFFSEK